MSGQGGYKHRKGHKDRQRSQHRQKGRENLRRVRLQFESKGQTWDPESNPAQLAALNHHARRFVQRSPARSV